MSKIFIRQESPVEFPDIYNINRLAFGQKDESQLINRLRASDSYIPNLSLVAIKDNEPIGHILFTHINIHDQDGEIHPSLALAPMAVHPDYQGQGIGSQLVYTGLAKAKELGHLSVIVLGHKDYYPKFGFQPADTWGIYCDYKVPREHFMALELVSGGLDGVSGRVEYDEAFGEV